VRANFFEAGGKRTNMAKRSKNAEGPNLVTKRRGSRIRRENATKRKSAKEEQEYPSIPAPLATFDILWPVLKAGASNIVMAVAREIPRTKDFEGTYKQEGIVQHLNIALGVQTLLAYRGLVAILGSGARAKDELRALEVGIGDIDYRLAIGREYLTTQTAFESEDEVRRSALHRYAVLQADPEAADGALRELILAETEAVRLVFRAYQRAQLLLEAERKSVGKRASESVARQERAFTHASSHLSPIEACRVAYLADINAAELWIQYATFFGKTFELARFIGRVSAGVEATLNSELFEVTQQMLAAQSQETDLSVLWVSLRQLLNLTISTRKFDFAVRIGELADGTIHMAPVRRDERICELTVEGRDGSRYAIVEHRDGAVMVIALALQLSFLLSSESMGNHDSDIVDADGVD
jgi:hypothetical protein